MEKFYFERPSLKRKDEIIKFLDEFIKYKSEINGSGGLDKIYECYTFEEALERTLNMEKEEYARKVGRCQGRTFLLIRESDNRIVATVPCSVAGTERLSFGIANSRHRKQRRRIPDAEHLSYLLLWQPFLRTFF